MGLTTYESVLKATREPSSVEDGAIVQRREQFVSETAEHDRLQQSLAQLPAAPVCQDDFLVVVERHRACRRRGRSHRRSRVSVAVSSDIFGPKRDVNQIPDDVHHRRVHLLNAMNAVRRHNETVIGHVGKTPTVLARRKPPSASAFHAPLRAHKLDSATCRSC